MKLTSKALTILWHRWRHELVARKVPTSSQQMLSSRLDGAFQRQTIDQLHLAFSLPNCHHLRPNVRLFELKNGEIIKTKLFSKLPLLSSSGKITFRTNWIATFPSRLPGWQKDWAIFLLICCCVFEGLKWTRGWPELMRFVSISLLIPLSVLWIRAACFGKWHLSLN